jgi:hypothetical protein
MSNRFDQQTLGMPRSEVLAADYEFRVIAACTSWLAETQEAACESDGSMSRQHHGMSQYDSV